MQVTVEIPDELVSDLLPSAQQDIGRGLLELAVAEGYRRETLSLQQVRQLLGYRSRMEVDSFIHRHQIDGYTPEDLEKDFSNLERLFPRRRPLTA